MGMRFTTLFLHLDTGFFVFQTLCSWATFISLLHKEEQAHEAPLGEVQNVDAISRTVHQRGHVIKLHNVQINLVMGQAEIPIQSDLPAVYFSNFTGA